MQSQRLEGNDHGAVGLGGGPADLGRLSGQLLRLGEATGEEAVGGPGETAVPPQERLTQVGNCPFHRLEVHPVLVVHQRGLDERGELWILVDEAFEIAEQPSELAGGWRDERSRLYRRARRPDPVLGGAELAGLTLPAPDTGDPEPAREDSDRGLRAGQTIEHRYGYSAPPARDHPWDQTLLLATDYSI